MQDVPAGYLLWLREQWKNDPETKRKSVSRYIEDNLNALCEEVPDYVAD